MKSKDIEIKANQQLHMNKIFLSDVEYIAWLYIMLNASWEDRFSGISRTLKFEIGYDET